MPQKYESNGKQEKPLPLEEAIMAYWMCGARALEEEGAREAESRDTKRNNYTTGKEQGSGETEGSDTHDMTSL